MTTGEKDIVDALKKGMKGHGFEVMEGQEALDWVMKEFDKPENVKARRENDRKNKSNIDKFFAKEHKYKWQKGMGEISGMGGNYEQGCRVMVIAGLEYWDRHPDLNPRYRGYKDVYGILSDDNEDAKMLDDKVLESVHRECTGAMHQAAIQTILYIKKHGWDKYVKEMSKKK